MIISLFQFCMSREVCCDDHPSIPSYLVDFSSDETPVSLQELLLVQIHLIIFFGGGGGGGCLGFFPKNCLLCIDVWIRCMNRNGTLGVTVTEDLGTLQDRVWCDLQAPLTFPCGWELLFPFNSSSLSSSCTSWGTYLPNMFNMLFCLDVSRWEEWRVLYRVLRVLVHHMQGVPCGRSLHKFGQFSGPKTRPKSYLICVFSGKKK